MSLCLIYHNALLFSEQKIPYTLILFTSIVTCNIYFLIGQSIIRFNVSVKFTSFILYLFSLLFTLYRAVLNYNIFTSGEVFESSVDFFSYLY